MAKSRKSKRLVAKTTFTCNRTGDEENSKICFDYQWQSEGILIVGNEEYGISAEILELCQDLVSIPMYGVKKSLNLACAFSVVSYLVPPYRSFSGD